VMAHAQRTIFMYGRNGQVHIILRVYQIWRAGSSVRSWQPILALEWLVTGLLTPLSCFPFTSLLRAGMCLHIVIELYYENTDSNIFGNGDYDLLDYTASRAAREHFSQLHSWEFKFSPHSDSPLSTLLSAI
jgi:hypothetical protein